MKRILSSENCGNLDSGKESQKDFASNHFEAQTLSALGFYPYTHCILSQGKQVLGLCLQTIKCSCASWTPAGKLWPWPLWCKKFSPSSLCYHILFPFYESAGWDSEVGLNCFSLVWLLLGTHRAGRNMNRSCFTF